MKRIYLYVLGIGSLFVGISVYAQSVTCTPKGDCQTIGYNKTPADCSDGLKCPFDTKKVFCLEILTSPEKPTPPEIPEECEVGSILYSDMSCSKLAIRSKTPIAIVFDKAKRLAISLKNSPSKLTWGGYGKDIPDVSSCADDPTLCNPDGKVNTLEIIRYGSINGLSYPAAEYCSEYTTAETQAGYWYLPSFMELADIVMATSQINASLELLGERALTDEYWSSAESNSGFSWVVDILNENYASTIKNNDLYVRPILAF